MKERHKRIKGMERYGLLDALVSAVPYIGENAGENLLAEQLFAQPTSNTLLSLFGELVK